MNFKNYLLLNERTLYHGTVIDNKDGIEKYGLLPQVGKWVKDTYGIEYDVDSEDDLYGTGFDDPEKYWAVVFAGDKEGLRKAVGGMQYHIGQKLGKYITDVTFDDIKNYGMLVLIDSDVSNFVKHDDENHAYHNEHQPPPSVEPDDYWTRDSVSPKAILTGPALIRYLNKFGMLSDKRQPLFYFQFYREK